MRHRISKVIIIVCSIPAALLLFLFIYFLGAQGVLAIKLATGMSIQNLQTQVNEIQGKVIEGTPLDAGERQFLRDLYVCLAKGGRLTVVLRQSGAAMQHYLTADGTPLKTGRRIFVKSDVVQRKMAELRKRVLISPPARWQTGAPYTSNTFNMAHKSCMDSFTGLYYGHLEVQVK